MHTTPLFGHSSREQYKSVVENARDFIFLLDEKGTVISANTAAARALGIPAAGIKGKCLADFFAPEDAKAMMAHVQDVVDGRKSLEVKSVAHIRDRVYWLSTHWHHLFCFFAAGASLRDCEP